MFPQFSVSLLNSPMLPLPLHGFSFFFVGLHVCSNFLCILLTIYTKVALHHQWMKTNEVPCEEILRGIYIWRRYIYNHELNDTIEIDDER